MSLESILGKRCDHCGHVAEVTHWNPAGNLPPVGSPLIIRIPAGDYGPSFIVQKEIALRVIRTGHISNKEGAMIYQCLATGMTLQGRFEWTHP